MKNLMYLLTLTLTLGCQSSEIKTEPNKTNSIEGVWELTQVITKTPGNQFANPNPQTGIFIFTEKYYSMTWNPNDAKQEDYKDKWQPSDEEKTLGYNSIITNSGTYKLTKGKLEASPQIAKNPAFIGGKAVYDYLVNDNSLTLTLLEIISHDGINDERIKNYKTTIKLRRVE